MWVKSIQAAAYNEARMVCKWTRIWILNCLECRWNQPKEQWATLGMQCKGSGLHAVWKILRQYTTWGKRTGVWLVGKTFCIPYFRKQLLWKLFLFEFLKPWKSQIVSTPSEETIQVFIKDYNPLWLFMEPI